MFGEFSENTPAGAWNQKLDCTYNDYSKLFEVPVCIKLGQKFKFIVDGGKEYAVSDQYIQMKDSAGNMNNVYMFQSRTPDQNKGLIESYKSLDNVSCETISQRSFLTHNFFHEKKVRIFTV